MKPPVPANDNVDLRTRQVWEPRLGHDLSPEGARQITADMTGFFGLLVRWSQADPPVPANDSGAPAHADLRGVRDDG
jgi:hypothetical protein